MSAFSVKRGFAASVVMIILAHFAMSQDPLEDSADRLQGRVHTLRTEIVEFSWRTGKRAKDPRRLSSVEFYDPNGEISKSIVYKPDGKIEYEWIPPLDPNEGEGGIECSSCDQIIRFKIKPHYNERGQVIKESDITAEGELIAWREFNYDEAGNRIEECEYEDGFLRNKEIHTYDQEGNKRSTTRYDSDDQLDGKWKYHYDTKRRLVEVITYNSNDFITSKARYRYDSKDNLIEDAGYDSDDTLSGKENYVYHYDSKGNWIKRTTYVTTGIGQPKVFSTMKTKIVYRTITYY